MDIFIAVTKLCCSDYIYISDFIRRLCTSGFSAVIVASCYNMAVALTEELPSKLELIDGCPKSPLLYMDVQFDDLRECTSENFQRAFMDAWKVL